jgi:mono/diheme cytochrome c family protein
MLTRLLTILTAAALTLSGCTNTGGEARPSGKPGEAPVAVAAAPGAAATTSAKPAGNLKGADSLSEARVVELGERIYTTQGGNTCNDCHGVAGNNGRLKQAADLTKPSTWKGYKAVGGDLAKLEERIVFLIENGAGIWNEKHPDEALDVQMMGVTQGATKTTLRKMRKELKKVDGVDIPKKEAQHFGAKAVYAYVMTKMSVESAGAPPAKAAAPAAPAAAPAATK